MDLFVPSEGKEAAIRAIAKDPWIGHKLFFHRRWTQPPADFHPLLARDFWFGARRKQILGFRGCAKSTTGESNIALAGALRTFRNLIVIGASEARAAERLAPVAFQLTQNEDLLEFFGNIRGPVWTQTKLVMTSGYCIQALGRDQDIRGLKHMDWRPDFVFVDDFEDKESVQTPGQREKTYDWFLAELLLACEPDARILINGTPLDEDSVPMRLQRAGWPTRLVPIEYRDGDTGDRVASWPERFSLEWIDSNRRLYQREGKLRLWDSEMMMQPRSIGSLTFTKDQFRLVPRDPSWHAVYAFIDPARTTTRTSATTGWAVWSWVGQRLVVWAAGADLLSPVEIVDLCFTIEEGFKPVWIGVEVDGLEEFLMQPLRHEQARRGVILPVRGMRAPKGKLDFIRGLQPFFAAGEVEFARPLPELEEQLLGFPTGRIDAPNALAYALTMRPTPIYEDFSADNIALDLSLDGPAPLFLAANATLGVTTAALLRVEDDQTRIFADWIVEGSAAEGAAQIYSEAARVGDQSGFVEAQPATKDWGDLLGLPKNIRELRRLPIRWVVPPKHGERWTNVGLESAIRHLPADLLHGGGPGPGRVFLRDALRLSRRGAPTLVVSETATWTLRAFAGGYCRVRSRDLIGERNATAEAEPGPYATLMEGIESFVAMGATVQPEAEAAYTNYSVGRDGRRYISAIPTRR